jgi:tRNA nucleotidyltransferase (CCA-adding enzyme)
MNLPDNVKRIISVLESAGHEAFIVGGCVRDIIRGTEPKDWDIAASALPAEVKELFPRTFDTGIKHGTVTVLFGKERYEVTTYRVDGEYLDSRRPETVIFAGKIEEDLGRRDFTVNAVAYNPSRGFVDPFGGRGDIEKRIIKCAGDAENRFGEDALRMLRAVRFAAQLGFSVDTAAVQAITKLKQNLEKISAERIREELFKLICGAYPDALKLLETTGLLYYTLRNRDYRGDLNEVIRQLKEAPNDEDVRLVLFFHNEPHDVLRDLRCSNKEIDTVTQYIKFLPARLSSRYEIKKVLNEMPADNFQKLLTLKEIINGEAVSRIREEARDIEKNECYTLSGLAVNGDDLAAAGIPEGRITGETLARLLDEVMRDPSKNTKEKLLRE